MMEFSRAVSLAGTKLGKNTATVSKTTSPVSRQTVFKASQIRCSPHLIWSDQGLVALAGSP